jgi:ABC-type bacteriocin/lantibiotic exporter with double-glycine peptidase domain
VTAVRDRQTATARRWLAPEVIQSSAMDCGPAALKSLLDGHRSMVNYGRLREACQTDVDGTSINSLEDIAVGLGLNAEQILVPSDHVVIPGAHAVPAIAVIVLPPGVTHFVVIWRVHGPLVQIMDPRSGRRWMSRRRLRSELYQHHMNVEADVWRSWAGSPEAIEAFTTRLTTLGVPEQAAERLVQDALQSPEWGSVALLDAAIRTTTALTDANACRRGSEAAGVVENLYARARELPAYSSRLQIIPEEYWSVSPASPEPCGDLRVRGAVLVRVNGQKPISAPVGVPDHDGARPDVLFPDLLAAGTEDRLYPLVEVLRKLRGENMRRAVLLAATIVGVVGGLLFEPVLLRALLGIGRELQLSGQRIIFIAAVATLQLLLLAGQWIIANETRRYGRRLEVGWRVALQEKLSRLDDQYFRSRLTADMAARVHSLHTLRILPEAIVQLIVAALSLLVTGMAIIWVDPRTTPIVAISLLVSISAPLLMQPTLMERDLRVRTHLAALSRFFFDSLRGLVPVRYHNAQSAIRGEHEMQSREWFRARLSLQRAVVSLESIQVAASLALAAWLITAHLTRSGDIGSILLLVYWTLQLPPLAQQIAQLSWQYPAYRNIAARVLELTSAPEPERGIAASVVTGSSQPGVRIEIRNATVRVTGLAVLHGIELQVEPGSQIAIVGRSGAGKSTLLGLLMGWHTPISGDVCVDGQPLNGETLSRLWATSAWMESGVHIWNRTLLANLWYGASGNRHTRVPAVVEGAGLRDLLARLPHGLQTYLGEGGGLVSGSEGQRIRLARAMFRPHARLAVLDEPFSGLERAERERLLITLRTLWRGRTMFYATHDIASTLSFDRVLVLDRGKIVEDDRPSVLQLRPDSEYSRLLKSSAASDVYASWRRLRFADGHVTTEAVRAVNG